MVSGSGEQLCLKSVCCPYVVNFSHFQLLQNHCMPSLSYQTYHKCSSRSPEKVLLLFIAQNSTWLPWPLIGRDILTSQELLHVKSLDLAGLYLRESSSDLAGLYLRESSSDLAGLYLRESSSDLAGLYPRESSSVITFQSDLKSKMTTLSSDWSRQF